MDRSFVCDRTLADGTPCRQAFPTFQALAAHKSSTKGGTHDDISPIAILAITNACPFCKNIFSSTQSAQNHIGRSLRGDAVVQEAMFSSRLRPPLTCGVDVAAFCLTVYISCLIMSPHMLFCRGPKCKDRTPHIFVDQMALTPWARTGADTDGKPSKRQAAGSEKFLMQGIQVLTKPALKNAMDVRELQAASLLCGRFEVRPLRLKLCWRFQIPRPNFIVTSS